MLYLKFIQNNELSKVKNKTKTIENKNLNK